jgi:hypothetical protein
LPLIECAKMMDLYTHHGGCDSVSRPLTAAC